jgi:alpha-L-rhamnosidase
MKKIIFTVIIVVGYMTYSCNREKPVKVSNLRCELLTAPIGIDCANPRLTWEINSKARAVQQTSYHLLVASSLKKLNADEGDLWDSQEVKSGESVFVAYGGKPLESRAACFWKVKVTTHTGTSEWSQPASWTMGLLQQSDWQAKWTGLDKMFKDETSEGNTRLAARYLRKEFSVDKKPVKATVYISGMGLYKLYINGKKTGNQELSPTLTDYTKVVKYNTFDVTNELVKGKNAIATILGNGRFFPMRQGQKTFGFPKMICQLEIEYADGSKQTVVSDDSWKVTADGAIRANNEYDGEEYDARMETPGWDKSGFDDSKWLQAELVKAPGGKLEAQLNRNITVMEILKPVNIKQTQAGTYILDMGQIMAGWVSMKVKGKAGDKVQLRFGESLQADGSLFVVNQRGALVTDIYTLKGGAVETWEPSFVFHGFRYVEITGYPGEPAVNDFEGKLVYDELEVTGQFETSNATINQIYKNAYWCLRNTYRSMPTDCCRDERMGWMGDRAGVSQGESFVFNINNLYSKWLDDIEQSQRETGSVPDVAPNYWSVYSDNMPWPGVYVIIANRLYEQYGNKEPIAKHYDSMKKWVNYMREKYLVNNIMTKDTYGDWCMPPESSELIHSNDPLRITDAAVLGTSFYYHILNLLARFADILDKPDDAKTFLQEAVVVKDAYNERFFNKENAQYSNNTVTANLLSLKFGMVPEGFENKVCQNIVNKTENEFNGHVSTGLVGIQWLMRGLSDNGRADLAYKIATNRDYPSWGYMIENGATSIWELWNGNTANQDMNAQNHVMMLGDLLAWFYEYLAGIRNDAAGAGFEKIVMHPYPVDGLDHVTASYHSVKGEIKSAWKKKDGLFLWDITVPGNSTATVYIPASDAANVTEGGVSVSSGKDIRFVRTDGLYAVYEIGSGSYHFQSK